MKNRFSVVRIPITVLLLAATLGGCTTTRHSVEISNVPSIGEIYIRNTGTASWGSNIAKNIQDIDRSSFSERVDIRVVDTSGIVYSRNDVPFNEDAFVETRELYSGTGTTVAFGIISIPILILLIKNKPVTEGGEL
jgi:hypothetical protein